MRVRKHGGGALALLAAACVFALILRAHGIILYRTGDPSANTTAPGGTLANSGWQYEGAFGAFLGTPIAPHFFITAQHIGFISDKLVFRGVNYSVTGSFDGPGSDLRVFQVTQTFPAWTRLYTGSAEVGKHLVAIGRGTQRGAGVTVNGSLHGWMWGGSDTVQRWGENIVSAIKQRPPGGDMIYALFDRTGLPNECHLSTGDSAGGVFLDDGGVWKLAGINYDVDGGFSTTANGNIFPAALFDERGLFDPNHHLVSGTDLVPSGFYASRISSRVPWIESVVEPRLTNISLRAVVGVGNDVTIAGFIVEGTPGQSRRVVLRGLGSSLAVNGTPVAGRLADPLIELHNAAGAVIATNDSWRSSAQAVEVQALGFAPADDREAALAVTLPVGAYTVILRGVNGSSGIGLAEVYDVGAIGNARLLNLSGRAFVSTGDNVLIGGVTVRALSQRLLLRAIGPELIADLPNVLPDPVLELHNANGALIASNDNWQTASNSAVISATGLAPTNSRESAILLAPGAGQFTGIVRGVGSTTGVALLEAYLIN